VLYAMMAVAAWLVWRRVGLGPAVLPWFVQLGLNFAWSWIFFGLRRPGWALAELVLLWLAILWTIAAFAAVHPLAAWLLAPYLGWVSFAGALNLSILRLNGARPA
jgi:tryptophan-rich sensory protein